MQKDKIFRLRCTQNDRKAIADLARGMGVKQSEAVRRAVLQAAEFICRQGATN